MIFSVNYQIVYYNSGIEHAEFKRTKLFHDYHQPTKILVDCWDLRAHYYLHRLQIPNNDVINMYDYYQHAIKAADKSFYIQDLPGFNSESVKDFGNCKGIQHGSNLAVIYFFDMSGYRERIRKINYFIHGTCTHTDDYDVRGFLSRRIYYKNGHEYRDDFLSPTGKVEMKKIFYKNPKDHQYYSKYYVWSAKRPIYSRADLILHFFNLLCLQYGSPNDPVIFISDRWWRNKTTERLLCRIKYPHYLAYYAHFSHIYEDNKTMTWETYPNFLDIFKQAKNFSPNRSYDALICSTHRQAKDIKQHYHISRPLFTIPVGIQNKRCNPHLKFTQRWHNQITCITRVSPVEGVLDTIRAFGIAKQSYPKLKLVIYGQMGPLSKKFKEKLSKIESTYGFSDLSVSIRDYTTHVLDVYSKSRLTLVTAPNDAFNISLLEALSQGCPAIVYTKNYGPRDMIINNYNGYKINNNCADMAKKIVYLFKHPKVMKLMSSNAYKSSFRFSKANIWKRYNKLINDAKNKWTDKLI